MRRWACITLPEHAGISPEVLFGCRFRLAGHYTLVRSDRLTPREREVLDWGRRSDNPHGVLSPQPGVKLGVRELGADAGLLLEALREPDRFPSASLRTLGDGALEAVAQLVLDGLLEVEWRGAFVFGAEAAPLFLDPLDEDPQEHALAELSIDALRHAQALPPMEPAAIARRLYRFNTMPVTPRGRRRVDTEVVLGSLGADGSAPGDGWQPAGPRNRSDAWLAWHASSDAPRPNDDAPTFKLYVSPVLPDLRRAIHEAAPIAARCGAFSFKVGRDLPGLLRPDKLVFYFASREPLEQAGDELIRRLRGLRPQGVPFTASLSVDGLVSWGVDPPRARASGGILSEPSWRRWLTHRLASAVAVAKLARPGAMEPARFAVARVAREGVTPHSWVPAFDLWGRGQ